MNLAPKPPSAVAEPDSLLLYGAPKIGKSRLLSALPCYVFQLDPGGQRQHGGAYDEYTTWESFDLGVAHAEQLKDQLPRFLAVDPLDRLEDLAAEKALATYRKQFPKETHVRTVADLTGLPHGAGYGRLREAFMDWIRQLARLQRILILTAHVRPKALDKGLTETNTKDLALTGKICQMVCGAVDTIGFVYRNGKGELVMATRTCSDGKQDINCGSRIARLADREIVLSHREKDGTITTFWNEIFPSLRTPTT